MKLKPLVLTVALLAVAAALVFWRRQAGAVAPAADARVGQPLVALATLQSFRGLQVVSGGQSVELTADAAGQRWTVPGYHGFPADFDKLVTLVESLRAAKFTRFVTAQPERLERLGFAGDRIELRDAAGQPLLTLQLGKNNESGGRFVRLNDEPKAYLSDLNVWLDPVAKNWARSQLLDVKPDAVAAVEFHFADAAPFAVKRSADTATWTAEGLPEGQELRATTIDSLVAQLTTLRFSETTEPTAPEAVAAREHAQTVVLTLKDGTAYTIATGRRPAPPAPAKAEPAPAATEPAAASAPAGGESPDEAAPAAAPKAGPVFAFISVNRADDPLNALMQQRAFEINEWAVSSLPANREALLQDKVAPPAAAPAPAPAQ